MRLRTNPKSVVYFAEIKNVACTQEDFKEELKKPGYKVLEIGAGKGLFITEYAKMKPDWNFFAIDGAVEVLAKWRFIEGISNITNLKACHFFAEKLEEVFEQKSIDRIFINFPDPWPKSRHASKRLVSKEFLDKYAKILKQGAIIEFKTDQKDLYEFALNQIAKSNKYQVLFETNDLHKCDIFNVHTGYELKFKEMGLPIYRIDFVKDPND